MIIYINDLPMEFEENSTLNDIISSMDNLPKQIALALNNAIIAKNKWENTVCKNGDRIVVVELVCGG
ncbi:MAG: sulfur carrier protein ThiS [Ignavibacteria bacterium]|jgi:thiamine biosynthesis protein ThiS|nr:sulfur carrier protein ThiS [Ignavibacteria bacterium]